VKILKTFARIFVADLGQSLPVFEYLVGAPADFQVRFEDVKLASVGDFLLIAGPPTAAEKYRLKSGKRQHSTRSIMTGPAAT